MKRKNITPTIIFKELVSFVERSFQNNRNILLFYFICFAVAIVSCKQNKTQVAEKNDFTRYVNPMTGTAGSGHTFPGATMPFGMVQVSPDTDLGGWSRCSGYHYDDSSIVGFSHTHISGTGVGDMGDFLFQPIKGKVYFRKGSRAMPDTGYRSRFSHDDEVAAPGYYSVLLKDYGIKVELTATNHAGLHRYKFPSTDSASVLVDLSSAIYSGKKPTIAWSNIRILNDSVIAGYKLNNGWAKEKHIYFAAVFSKPFRDFKLKNGAAIMGNTTFETAGNDIQAVFNFDAKDTAALLVKVGISYVSSQNALANVQAEIPHWNFNLIRSQARDAWNKELSKIDVETDSIGKKIFYTAMYHAFIAPNQFMDVNGQYRGLDQNIYQSVDFTNYTVFSLWDTYRALHPLFTILQRERTSDMINSMLAHYEQNPYKMLPVWSLVANETWCMIGYHAIPVIVDAYMKGIEGFDPVKAMEAMVSTSTKGFYQGLEDYMKLGYVPVQHREPVSRTLEFAYDDWCIAEMAAALGDEEISTEYEKRSLYYKNLFDSQTKFMRAKDTAGNFTTKNPSGKFDPLYAHYGHDYTEGNAWQYSWYVPQDVPGLISLMGGEGVFESRLDSLFIVTPELNENAPHDISGLIGQYAHGNEPSHHVAYLYNYIRKPWKSQEKVHQIMKELYSDGPNGLCGNDDCGQMSAWYIFSAMGFYPVNPASSVYAIGKPMVSQAAINMEDGKQFLIKAKNLSDKNKYVQSVKLNGVALNRSWVSHKEIISGGILEFEMGNEPNIDWASELSSIPASSAFDSNE